MALAAMQSKLEDNGKASVSSGINCCIRDLCLMQVMGGYWALDLDSEHFEASHRLKRYA